MRRFTADFTALAKYSKNNAYIYTLEIPKCCIVCLGENVTNHISEELKLERFAGNDYRVSTEEGELTAETVERYQLIYVRALMPFCDIHHSEFAMRQRVERLGSFFSGLTGFFRMVVLPIMGLHDVKPAYRLTKSEADFMGSSDARDVYKLTESGDDTDDPWVSIYIENTMFADEFAKANHPFYEVRVWH